MASEHSIAAAALELLLDATEGTDVEQALVTESATYSLLQAGPEHQAWRARRTRRERQDEDDEVLVTRDGPTLHLTLNRPHVHNAFNAAMREALLDGLEIASVDPAIEQVLIDGAGASFCFNLCSTRSGTRPWTEPPRVAISRTSRELKYE